MPTGIYIRTEYHKKRISESMPKGVSHPMWKGGMPNCIDCGLKVSAYNYKRCIKCHNKYFSGERKNTFKGWVTKQPGYWGFMKRKRRNLIKNSIENYTFEEWENLKKLYKYMCLCCKRFEPEINLTPDHIIPLSRGGSNGINNIQPLCLSCNQSKFTKTIDFRMGVLKN